MAFGNGPRLVTTGLDLLVDAADKQSYPGSGTVWTDLRSGITGSLTGSVTYTSEFYGGLTFSNSSSAVIFPGSTANYGTGSFTVEMAFKPTYIEGRHYLMSKNSGSFPNWAIYLSGSNGSGKLWSEFNIDASVSCSVSSSTTFTAGTLYQVDIRIAPAFSASSVYVNGLPENLGLGNNGGSLTTTASLFVGNFSQNNTQNFSGSIYTIKTYLQASTEQPVINFNATSTRFSKPPVPETAKKVYDILIIAGGGGGGRSQAGGGGAGGLQVIPATNLNSGINTVVVGGGGASNTNGANSSLNSYVSIGGGNGSGGLGFATSSIGGSGGGGAGWGVGQGVASNGIIGQGNPGGVGVGNPTDGFIFGSGGGGGAGEAGRAYNAAERPGQGGSGSYIASFAAIGGSPAGWFAGGGGGGYRSRDGGIGGGGAGGGEGPGANGIGKTGSINTGGGGGGGGNYALAGGAGGSGIVAIRYSGGPIALGGEITQSGGFTYHVFRATGSSSFTIF